MYLTNINTFFKTKTIKITKKSSESTITKTKTKTIYY